MGSEVRQTRVIQSRAVRVLAGLTIGCVGALAPVGSAVGAPADGTGAGVHRPKLAAKMVLPHKDIPKNAVRATYAKPKLGSSGPAFQKAGTGRSGSARVVGGTVAEVSQFPWIVGIETRFLALDEDGKPGEWVTTCTGTIVSSTKILTVGHCARGLPYGTTYVYAGRNDLRSLAGGYVARVASTWTDQNFNLAALNAGTTEIPVDDVSVLTLQEALPAVYTPIALTAQGDQTPYAAGTSATVLGYGVTSNSTSDTGVLHKATVPIQSDTTCATISGYDSGRLVCAGDITTGTDTCGGDSGGPLVVNGVQAGITDWGLGDCGASYGMYERLSRYSDRIKTDMARPSLINLDWTGDGHSDLMTRDADGFLYTVTGSGFANDGDGGITGYWETGSGWNGYSKLFRVTDWNNDNAESIMAMTSTGALYQYQGDGAGWFVNTSPTQIGTGWNMFSDIMVVNNWTGDGRPNLLGRTPSGDLYLYTSDGQGGWLNNGTGIKIGSGWNMFNTVLTPGTWAGDGYQSLIGRTPAGDLYLYKSDGQGGWLNNGAGVKIGSGWNMFSVFMSPGDWNGDNMADLMGVTPAGAVRLYETDGHGNWLTPAGLQISEGWNVFNAVF